MSRASASFEMARISEEVKALSSGKKEVRSTGRRAVSLDETNRELKIRQSRAAMFSANALRLILGETDDDLVSELSDAQREAASVAQASVAAFQASFEQGAGSGGRKTHVHLVIERENETVDGDIGVPGWKSAPLLSPTLIPAHVVREFHGIAGSSGIVKQFVQGCSYLSIFWGHARALETRIGGSAALRAVIDRREAVALPSTPVSGLKYPVLYIGEKRSFDLRAEQSVFDCP